VRQKAHSAPNGPGETKVAQQRPQKNKQDPFLFLTQTTGLIHRLMEARLNIAHLTINRGFSLISRQDV
jgi:hypothetical protein